MNREYPEAPIVAVGVVLKRGPEVLLVQRLNEPSRGRWSLPGGAVELGETVREAARREVQEECGLQIEPGEFLAIVDRIVHDEAGRVRFHYVLIDLLAEYVSGELTPASDISDARWVRAEELAKLDVTEKASQIVREVLKPGPLGDKVAQLRSSAR
jgi:8-oxo-dGTP diphosphatase